MSDIHGNLPALEAVLAEIASLEVDRIVSCGDVVAGPFPRECLGRLLERDAIFVRGNADREPGAWVGGLLDMESLRFLRELPTSLAFAGVRYCHASPRSDEEILTRISPDGRFRAALDGVEERLVVGGHTHVQFERTVDGLRFANVGSVGRPYEGRRGAFWAVVEAAIVQFRCTPYALDAAVALCRSTGYPDEHFASNLLTPPDPDETSAHFEGLAA